MGNRNGYFQLSIRQDGTYLILYPAVGAGQPITYNDINRYLMSNRIYDYDVKAIGQAIVESKEKQTEVRIFTATILPVSEYIDVSISQDGMFAFGRFYPPSNGGQLLTSNDIINSLVQEKVKYGVVQENIELFLKNRIYCEDIIIAKGTKAEEGRDAVITYHFNTDRSLKPRENEDGTVDFHQLDMISSVNKGDILATLIPAIQGKGGIDVFGKPIQPRKVVTRKLMFGKDIHLSEDGLTMYSDVNGHVVLADSRVFVSNTYEVLADVDVSTGDISYEGNVLVKGNVINGFSVHAKGDIIVNGVVEGATLIAEGQIILKRGMQGMSKGKMEAGGNIISKFIENAEVKAGGYITTEAILHSKVSARGEIVVGGKKGLVTGGEIRSTTSINVKTAGSTMGTNTLLEVGIDPQIVEEFRGLEKKLISMNADMEKMLPILSTYKKKLNMGEKLSPDKAEYVKILTQNCLSLSNEIKESKIRFDELRLCMNNNDSGSIHVQNIAYAGVKIVISNVIYYVRNEVQHSKFIRDRADIKVVGLF